MATLYVVATPIGNLGDITLRALDILKNVSVILAEDTRVTRKLLSHFEIKTPFFPYSEHSHARVLGKILGMLGDGKDLALVSDAGTPGVSDPGRSLVVEVSNRGFTVVTIPGPSALAAAISISDIDLSAFAFFGFPPHKKGREKFFRALASYSTPIILFESPHRLLRVLADIERVLGDRHLNVGRELTKIYEEIFRGSTSEAKRYFAKKGARGEFVIVIAPLEGEM